MADHPGFAAKGLVIKVDQARQITPDGEVILNSLARLVGFTALGLPVLLAIGILVGGGCFRDSISHFYHTQFLGTAFVGLLFFIGGFMIAYTGQTPLERHGATLSGLCAIGVAMFPTSGSGCELPRSFLSRAFVNVTQPPPYTVTEAKVSGQTYFDLFGAASDLHMTFAGVVFVYLGLFCLLVLRRVIPSKHGEGDTMIQTKRKRNALYFWCGLVILACVAVLALKGRFFGELKGWNAWNLTFWVEAIALWAFGLSWLAKGRFFKQLNDAG